MGIATKRPSGQRYTKALKEALLAMLPEQGCWSEERYLYLTDSSNRLVELTDGVLEFLPMPTDRHQAILEFLFELFFVNLRVDLLGVWVRIMDYRHRVAEDCIAVESSHR